ncbi:MAG: RNHCP domain-containing protein [Candidatus Hydrogenedentes bacterium]|nr:RNHCP domain-containing protein [Candidatus Hydrogenedentota bacterium]
MKPSNSRNPSPRPFIGILFKCCHVYARVYLNHDGTAYAGHCPKCAASLTVKAGPGGSDQRFWTAE